MEERKRVIVSEKAIHESHVLEGYRLGELSRKEVASILGLSERQVTRKYARYQAEGIQGLEHGSYGRSSPLRIEEAERDRIRELANEKYPDFNLKHLHEHLERYERVNFSYSSLKRMMDRLR